MLNEKAGEISYGFTGTPIEKTDANTRAVFDDYISSKPNGPRWRHWSAIRNASPSSPPISCNISRSASKPWTASYDRLHEGILRRPRDQWQRS